MQSLWEYNVSNGQNQLTVYDEMKKNVFSGSSSLLHIYSITEQGYSDQTI